MKNHLSFLLLIPLLFNCTPKAPAPQSQLSKYVNPFIGTDGKGKTYPGASVPFGRIQLSPDNGRSGWDYISGYFYPDSVIAGFSHTHLSGTGIGDLYDISFLPVSGELKTELPGLEGISNVVHSSFSHENESAEPGYYQVYLEDYNINVELTATDRTGLQRYRFDKGKEQSVRLHLGYARNWDGVTASSMEVLNDSTVVGYRHSDGWAKDQKIFFATVFSVPFKGMELYEKDEFFHGEKRVSGKDVLGVFNFGEVKEILVKTAISSVSVENALENLRSELAFSDFDVVREAARQKWEKELQKVQIEAAEEVKEIFYTSMYHSLLAPTLFDDSNSEYIGPDKQVHRSEGFEKYSTFSLWDTYRAQHPWLTITQPDKVPDMMKSLLSFYEESGRLPVWNMMGSETDMMIGYHAVPVLADALFKGLATDTLEIYEAMKASALQDKFGLKELQELGYVPYDFGNWNVSMTMEYAYDDWCIGQVAELLGKREDAEYFGKRSQNYLNHFDSLSRYFRPKSAEGEFKKEFDPLAYDPEDFCEANGLQYYWYVPHDVENLIHLTGGAAAFEDRLDSLFIIEQSAEETPVWISGYIGQYVHGNEPSHHVPYLYQYIGKPEKTQIMVRRIMKELYSTAPDGLAGNEDCGQMSAWYLFSSLGIYPVNPADGKYILGSPAIESAKIQLPGGKVFEIEVKNQGKENVLVKSVTLNGIKLDRYYITHEEIMAGGKVLFELELEREGAD